MGDLVPVGLALGVAFVLAVLLSQVARWAGLRLGIVDRAGQDPLKVHSEPISVLGGIAVTAAVVASLGAVGEQLSWWVLGAVSLTLVTGFVDDLLRLSALLRMLLLAAAGLTLIAGGFGLEVLGGAGAAAAVLLLLACGNAVNLLDGQDGLAGGIAAIAALGLAALAAAEGQGAVSALGLSIAGALLGFLVWNRPPARIFLGNSGAYAVGALLAVLAGSVAYRGWSELLAAGACLGVLVFELAFTTVRRLGSRTRVFGGDRLHTYDLLAGLLRSRTRATLVFWGLALACSGLGLVVARVPLPAAILLVVLASAGAGLWGVRLWARGTEQVRGTA